MKIRIEKGVPIPPQKGRPPGGSPLRAALREMEIGDSFAVGEEYVARTRNAISALKRASRRRFITRAEGDGIRVWRVEDATGPDTRPRRPGGAARTQLTEEQVRELADLARSGATATELASRYSISVTHAARILRGQAWSDVTGIDETSRSR